MNTTSLAHACYDPEKVGTWALSSSALLFATLLASHEPGAHSGWLTAPALACPGLPLPLQHLVLPTFKQPEHMRESQYLGGKLYKRDILAFFQGDMGQHRELGCSYSR